MGNLSGLIVVSEGGTGKSESEFEVHLGVKRDGRAMGCSD